MSKTRDEMAMEYCRERGEQHPATLPLVGAFNAGYDARELEIEELREQNATLREKNRVLAEALEFYAERKNWDEFDCAGNRTHFIEDDEDSDNVQPINHRKWSGGKRARAALEQTRTKE